MRQKVVEVKNLTKIYKTGKGAETIALDNVSLSFGESGLVFILGRSGSGKTTLLNLLGGLDFPTGGEIIVNGKSNANFKSADLDNFRNSFVGFVFQEYNLIPDYTVAQNVALSLELQNERSENKVDEVLRKVDLVDSEGNTLGNRNVNELSGGQKQRVAIARALVKNSEIILADEPTGALDSQTGEQLYELLKKLSRNRLVVVVTHDRQSADKFGDRIIEIADGKIISDAVKNEICRNDVEGVRAEPDKYKGLSAKRAFLIGAAGLKYQVFRLVISIIICVISFTGFGFSLTAISSDNISAELNSLKSKDMSCVFISSDNSRKEISNNNIPITKFEYITEKQLNAINKYNGGNPAKISRVRDTISKRLNTKGVESLNSPYYSLLISEAGVLELNPQTGMQDANLKIDCRFINKGLCKLPENENEIAITDLHADAFIEFGYVEDDETVTEIKLPDDLIGKTLGSKTICGVFSTEVDKSYFTENKKAVESAKEKSYMRKYFNSAKQSVITYSFVCAEDNNLSSEVTSVMIRVGGSVAEMKNLLKKLRYVDGDLTCNTTITTALSGFILEKSAMNTIKKAGLFASIILAVISVLLLMNFLSVNIQCRQKELGILRAMGASKKDVVTICLWESFIIAVVNFLLSLICLVSICLILNKVLFLSVFHIGFLQILALILTCFGVSALATLFPTIKLARKSPIDIIKDL